MDVLWQTDLGILEAYIISNLLAGQDLEYGYHITTTLGLLHI